MTVDPLSSDTELPPELEFTAPKGGKFTVRGVTAVTAVVGVLAFALGWAIGAGLV